MKKRLRSFNIYSSEDDNLVLWQLFHFGETQWREAEASGRSFARSWSARLRRSFACSPDKTANCAGYSFKPKTTFSLNFFNWTFQIYTRLKKLSGSCIAIPHACPKVSTLLLIRTKLDMRWCIFISLPNIYQHPFCPLSSRHACTPGPFRSLQGRYSFRKEFNGNKRIPDWNSIA